MKINETLTEFRQRLDELLSEESQDSLQLINLLSSLLAPNSPEVSRAMRHVARSAHPLDLSLSPWITPLHLLLDAWTGPLRELATQLRQLSQLGTPHDALRLIAHQALESHLAEARGLISRKLQESITVCLAQIDAQSEGETPEGELRAAPEAGDELGVEGWRLVELIARGRTGSIWRAERDRGGEGAVKVFHKSLSDRPEFGERFSSRAQALSRITHPVVLSLLGWGRDLASGHWYLVMPLVEGESLRSRLLQAPLEEVETRALARAIASALVVCHDHGLTHGHLTPEHIILSPGGSPMLIDFNLCLISSERGLALPKDTLADGLIEPLVEISDPSEDIFSFGMTLAESLGARAGDEQWAELISLLTHFIPTRRLSAHALLKRLNEVPNAYHIAVGDQSEGPLRLDDIVAMVLAGQEEVYVWWPGADGWSKWDQVIEILIRVEAEREPTIRILEPGVFKPPPASLPMLSAGDRVSQKAGEVVFYERFIPAFSPSSPDEVPLEAFWLMETQVTQQLYFELTQRDPSKFKGERRPVERVSWSDGVALCNALSLKLGFTPAYRGVGDDCELIVGANGYRLPFEREWAWAAQAAQDYKYAGSADLYEVGWYGAWNRSGNVMRGGGPQDVALLEPNAYGLYDMSGNVWEWCADDYDSPGEHRSSAKLRSRRGGSWGNDPSYCQILYRSHRAPGRRYDDLGLRLCRPVSRV